MIHDNDIVLLKLITMGILGCGILTGIFCYLHHLAHQWLTKFSIPVLVLLLLFILITLTLIF